MCYLSLYFRRPPERAWNPNMSPQQAPAGHSHARRPRSAWQAARVLAGRSLALGERVLRARPTPAQRAELVRARGELARALRELDELHASLCERPSGAGSDPRSPCLCPGGGPEPRIVTLFTRPTPWEDGPDAGWRETWAEFPPDAPQAWATAVLVWAEIRGRAGA